MQGPSAAQGLGTTETQKSCLYFPTPGISSGQTFLRPPSAETHKAKTKWGNKERFIMQLLNKG